MAENATLGAGERPATGRWVTATRWLLAAAGIAAIGVGGWQLLLRPGHPPLQPVATWLAGGVVLHDAVLAPLIVAVAWLLRRWGGAGRSPARRTAVTWWLGAVLAVAAVAALLRVPAWRSPAGAGNPTVHPYVSSPRWLAAAAVAVAVVSLAHWWAGRSGTGRSGTAARVTARVRRNGGGRSASRG